MVVRISDLNPEKSCFLEDLELWGFRPVLQTLEFISEVLGEDSDPEEQNNAYVLLNDVKIKIEDTVSKLEEFNLYVARLKKQAETATGSASDAAE